MSNWDFDRFVFTPRELPRRGVVCVVACAALVAIVLVTTLVHATGSASASSGPPAVLTPANGAYLGAFAGPRAGETRQQAFVRVEHEIGRKLAIDHEYYKWDTSFPTSQESWAVANGTIPFLNWKAQRSDGSAVRWSRIASGAEDAVIQARADALKAFGSPVYLTFHHEPEDDLATWGTPSEFAAAFRHVVDVFRSRGVTNVGFVWDMMNWTFVPASGRDPNAYYPGDGYVDFIGSDGYDWYPGKSGSSWQSFQEVFRDSDAFAVSHDKPWIAVETGVQEDPNQPGRKGQWFKDIIGTAQAWPLLKGVVYFDTIKEYAPNSWQSDSSASSVQGFAAIGSTPYFEPGGPAPPPSPSPSSSPSSSPNPSPSPSPSPSPNPSPSPSPSPTPKGWLHDSFDKGTPGKPVKSKGSGTNDSGVDAVVVHGKASLVYDDRLALGGTGLSAKHRTGTHARAYYEWHKSFGSQRIWFGRVYVYFGAFPSGTLRLVAARRSGALRMALDVAPSGRLVVKNRLGDRIAKLADPIATGRWVRIEWRVNQIKRRVEVRLFDRANLISATATSITPPGSKIGRSTTDVRIGRTRRESSSSVFWTDEPALSRSGFLGPA